MTNKLVAYIGIAGIALFAVAAIVGPLLIEDYSIIGQYISESFASNTKYGAYLQYLGYVPSGLFTTLYCFKAPKYLPNSSRIKTGFFGLAIFYGIGTMLVGLFPCDAGCPTTIGNSSTAQLIHNAAASLTYLVFPLCILIIGMGLQKFTSYHNLSRISFAMALLSGVVVAVLFADAESNYKGLLQRVIEITFITFIVSSAVKIKNQET
ncbi:DUF998 domain-containing protein [Maribacter confluentis]|uniref:DUF998 domain-containing protein n=1 Tax=Maribacter confluentis TaxID=1656093 RepID=A0ABT8RK87_9FLAO|nr:DUF998 domain-containing protein [Maribacter confluentis]MDO1511400.1 DUF998 domain-containing protein [Maribacter confluentis]